MIITLPTRSPRDIILNATDWRTAVADLIRFLVEQNRCFSSGEIAAYLRTFNPSLSFSVPSVGDYIRTLYADGSMPSYGGVQYPTQVPRVSAGVARTLAGVLVKARTPVGVTVFVYAPDGASGFAHDFEVYIPDWTDPQSANAVPISGQAAAAPQVTMVTPATATSPAIVVSVPDKNTAILITGALSRDDVTASVTPDRRVTIPRAAFESWVALTGQPIQAGPNGDSLFIQSDDREIVITRAQVPGSVPYVLWAHRGRVAVPSHRTPGEKFPISISTAEIRIKLQ